jgi:aspartyl-tRNA(Asn)/glutamyl-tRNA(Gln) amidotransferase subunit A
MSKSATKQAAPASTTDHVRDPGRLAAHAAAIARGKLSPVDLVQRCLDRIEEADGAVQCWRQVDGERALTTARERAAEAKAGRLRGPLHGIPVAIKDIIDVAGLTTLANSRSRTGAAPSPGDAEIVAALRAQGAVILGKVHTTEYAFFDPSPARNPRNTGHTPGGSSSGSAAAVAAGMAPLAIGTQTVASVTRPAAYCGISAFKPSTGSTSTFGITPLGPSYDTVGFYGFTVDDAVYAYEAIAAPFARAPSKLSAKSRLAIAIPVDAHIGDADPEIAAALDRTAGRLVEAGHTVTRIRSPIAFARLFAIQRSTMLYEAGRALRFLLDHPKERVGAKLREAIDEGLATPERRYIDERGEIATMRQAFWPAVADADLCLWPATPRTAPEGLAWTGDPKYISPWTALGGPIVNLPAGLSSAGLPIGCLVSSSPGSDAQMCAMARTLAKVLGV